jgi:ubiquinone/menaquinone biosynthesis C-methylase UbiE
MSPDAELYERVLVAHLLEPWAATLVAFAQLDRGQAVIDIACGTGIVARTARKAIGPDAPLVGVDRDPDMLEVARRVDNTIDWREGQAGALPVRDAESFDVAFCHQGIQFVSDKVSALRAMRRLLRPGGRTAVAVWRSLNENGVFAELAVVAERVIGPIDDQRYGFPDPDALERLFIDGGFRSVDVHAACQRVRFTGDPRQFARLNAMAAVDMSLARTRPEAERARLVSVIADASVNEIKKRVDVDGFSFPTSVNIAIGHA